MLRFVLIAFLLLPVSAYAGKLSVFVSVLPLQTFVEKVGGEHVQVRSMVRPGFSPHTYDPTPQQIGALSKAVLYVRAGLPFEKAWMERIASANKDMQILDARDGIELRELEAHSDHAEHSEHEASHDGHHGHEEHHDEHEMDPHVWTSPKLVRHMAKVIHDKLVELDPGNKSDYKRNYEKMDRELQELDVYIRKLLDPLPNRKFMVFHPSWGYFADSYGLKQKPIEDEGKQPGARALVALIEQARKEKIKVIFVQPQFDKRQAVQVSDSIGGGVIAVDPLASDYFGNMRHVAQQFAEALK